MRVRGRFLSPDGCHPAGPSSSVRNRSVPDVRPRRYCLSLRAEGRRGPPAPDRAAEGVCDRPRGRGHRGQERGWPHQAEPAREHHRRRRAGRQLLGPARGHHLPDAGGRRGHRCRLGCARRCPLGLRRQRRLHERSRRLHRARQCRPLRPHQVHDGGQGAGGHQGLRRRGAEDLTRPQQGAGPAQRSRRPAGQCRLPPAAARRLNPNGPPGAAGRARPSKDPEVSGRRTSPGPSGAPSREGRAPHRARRPRPSRRRTRQASRRQSPRRRR